MPWDSQDRLARDVCYAAACAVNLNAVLLERLELAVRSQNRGQPDAAIACARAASDALAACAAAALAAGQGRWKLAAHTVALCTRRLSAAARPALHAAAATLAAARMQRQHAAAARPAEVPCIACCAWVCGQVTGSVT